MKRLLLIIFWCGIFSPVKSQENRCLYFPMQPNQTWCYQSNDFPDSLISVIVDTLQIGSGFYFSYAPYGARGSWPRYWLRSEPKSVFALNTVDSTDYLLFDFDAEPDQSWPVPPVPMLPSNQPVNQCDWGSSIWLASRSDTTFNARRTFYNCRRFGHRDHPCNDAGIYITWFARDFGMVRFSMVTEGGVLDWDLVTDPPDTVTIQGLFTMIGNPCMTIPCLPGVVSAVSLNDTNYVLTKGDVWFDGDFSWQDHSPSMGDSVVVQGIITPRRDINGKCYSTVEVLSFEPMNGTSAVLRDAGPCPAGFVLLSNYPNPFNPVTRIRFGIPDSETTAPGILTRLTVYDILGKRIAVPVEAVKRPGLYEIEFDGSNLPGGMYFVSMRAGNFRESRKMILIK